MYQYGSFSYSCDKIKLKGILKRLKPNTHFHHYIRVWCENPPVNIECRKAVENCLTPFNYRYGFTLFLKGEKEGAFHIREHYNGDFKDGKQRPEQFLIEYNPNKSGAKIFKSFAESFCFVITEIIQFDLAYDVPNATIKDVTLNTLCDVMTYGKNADKTIYISPKEDQSGRVKVYTKSKEREAFGVQMSDTLRIEATIKLKGLDFYTIHVFGKTSEELTKVVNRLNSVKIKKSAADSEDWKLYALSHLSPEDFQTCLSLMAPNQKSKYRKIITTANYYTLDLDVTTLVIHILTVLEPWKRWIKIK